MEEKGMVQGRGVGQTGIRRLSRREVLRGGVLIGGGIVASALLAACGGEATATVGTGGGAASPAGSAAASSAAGNASAAGSAAASASSVAAGSAVPSAAASAAGATGGSPVAGTPAVSGAKPFTREASIVEWGFGADETNPLAFSRIEAFRKAYPSIKLEIVPQSDEQKILTAAASKSLPDLLWLGRTDLISYAARGIIRPIDDLVQRDGFQLSRLYPAAVEESRYEGKLYGMPQFHTARALYVNLDALKEAGVEQSALNTGDWDQLLDLAGKLVKRDGDRVERWGFDPKTEDFLWLWGLANGGKFISEDMKQPSFNDPKVVEALDWGKKVYDAQGGYKLYLSAKSTWKNDEQFARGQVAMTMYENFVLGVTAQTVPDLNFAVVPVRKRNGGPEDWIGTTGGNAWAITAGAKDPEAAWAFISFMADLQTWLLGANGVKAYRKQNNRPYTPTLTGDREADRLTIEQVYEPIRPAFDNAVRLFPQLLDKSVKLPVATSPVSKQLTDTLRDQGAKPALNGDKAAKAALDDANRAAQNAINAFQP
jgi:multiple sugar transport system substrate-binding protein